MKDGERQRTKERYRKAETDREETAETPQDMERDRNQGFESGNT